MIIKNKTEDVIYIGGNTLQPGNWMHVGEHIFDTINIYCDSGSAEIICEYTDRFIKCFGDLEIEKIDINNFNVRTKMYD